MTVVAGVTCSDGYSCTSTSQWFGGGNCASPYVDCMWLNDYSCNGQDSNCEASGIYCYTDLYNCSFDIAPKSGPYGCCLADGGPGDPCIPTTCNPVGFTSCEVDVGAGWSQTDTGVCQSIPAPGCPTGWSGVKHNCPSAYNTCEIQLNGVDNCGNPCGPETITCYQPPPTEVTCQRCSNSYKWSCASWPSGPDGVCNAGGDDKYGEATYSCCCDNCCPRINIAPAGNDGPCPETDSFGEELPAPPLAQFSGSWDLCVNSCCTPGCAVECPSGTSTSFSAYGYVDENCIDDCGDTLPDKCYCTSYNTATCPIQYSSDNLGFGFKGKWYSEENLCGYQDDIDCFCKSIPPAPSCPAGGIIPGDRTVKDNPPTNPDNYYGFYDTLYGDWNDCEERLFSDCWCTEECEPPACELEYSTVNVGFGTVSPAKTCTNICNDSNERNCYCFQCDLPDCDIGTDEDGGGWLIDDPRIPEDERLVQPACSNDCDFPEERACRFECLEAKCEDLFDKGYSDIDWLDSCPPTETCEEVNFNIPIDPQFPGCEPNEEHMCYYPNSDPEVVSIDISPTTPGNNVLNYTSTNHTGKELNNPITVTATYSDSDDAQDIKAMYVWFSKPKSEPISKDFTTPIYYIEDIDPNLGQTEDNSNFGLMFVRDGTGWDVYIPHIAATSSWVKKDNDIEPGETINIVREIDGGVEKTMVTVTQITITEPDSDTDTVQVSMDMNFEDGDELDEELVENGDYTVWGNVNDISGFDPLHDFDPYTLDEIRKPNNWVFQNGTWSRTIWNLDMIDPNVSIPSITIVDGQTIKVTVQGTNASDDMDLSYARLDACKMGGTANKPLVVEGISYPEGASALSSCTGYSENLSNFDMSSAEKSLLLNDSDIGTTLNPQVLDSVEKDIDLNDNEGGVITFYLTLMDLAGNYVQSHVNLKLGDWAVVEDGLVFGRSGTSSETRELEEEDTWDGSALIPYVTGTEIRTHIDLSNQALLGSMDSPTALRSLVHQDNTNAFKASNIEGTISGSIYSDLFDAFENKSQGDNFDVYEIPADSISQGMTLTDINGDGTINCDKKYCVLTQFEDETELTIGKGFQCNGKGLIIVDGDITINPNFTNSPADSACIILASGDITITPGDDAVGTPGYDQIQAFLIANGDITIQAENEPPPEDSDGLIVEGGLIAVSDGADLGSSTSIINERDIDHNHQLLKPVIFVKGRSKYAILGKAMFGSQVDIFKTELGFKPY